MNDMMIGTLLIVAGGSSSSLEFEDVGLGSTFSGTGVITTASTSMAFSGTNSNLDNAEIRENLETTQAYIESLNKEELIDLMEKLEFKKMEINYDEDNDRYEVKVPKDELVRNLK